MMEPPNNQSIQSSTKQLLPNMTKHSNLTTVVDMTIVNLIIVSKMTFPLNSTFVMNLAIKVPKTKENISAIDATCNDKSTGVRNSFVVTPKLLSNESIVLKNFQSFFCL